MGALVWLSICVLLTVGLFVAWRATRVRAEDAEPDAGAQEFGIDLASAKLASEAGPTADSVKKRRTAHRVVGVVAFAALAMTLISAASSTVVVVPVQQVGIPVTFGTPGAPMNNGLHLKAPWTDVTLMDGTVQIDDNLGDRRTEIRLGNQSIAYVQNNVRWRIRPEAADRLFRDHKTFERIGPALEEPELAAALNAALQDYNPLGTVTGDTPSRDQIADQVRARLTEKIGDRLIIESVTIPVINFDEQTQNRINAYQTEVGNTRIAEQRKKTAEAEAAANQTLAGSVSNDPNVLVSKCLDTLNEMVTRGQTVPVAFTCWPGSTGTSGVIVNSGR